MDKERVLVVLRSHSSELKSFGVAHLRIFGSLVRGQASAQSQVGLLADFQDSERVTLLSLQHLEHRISTLLSAPVEISAEEWMKESIRDEAVRDAIVAF